MFLYDAASFLESLYPGPTPYIGPNCDGLGADVDISEAWRNSSDRLAECEVSEGLGDV